MKKQLMLLYKKLFSLYGAQGWWPLQECKLQSGNSYHPERYDFPCSSAQLYEVLVGTILTQNSSWNNAVQALENLFSLGPLLPEKILELPVETIKEAIKPARYFNQKTCYIMEITKFFLALKGDIPSRQQLLGVRGVGEETADSMLLYGWLQPQFVVDAYTRRLLEQLGCSVATQSYASVKAFFEDNLPHELPLFMEFHALLVAHGKMFYNRRPYGIKDPLCCAALF